MPGLFLIIDITDFEKLTIVLWRSGELKKKIWPKLPGRHLNILACLDNFLKQAKIKLKDLSGLVLLEGNGSFSGTRQAAAILNTICLVEKIPALGVDKRKYGDDWQKIIQTMEKYFRASKKEKFIKPIYNGEPNITCPTI
ncbi:MAG TPA: hypothetical protein DEB73_00295 [Candidatus Magasanikbacteria bacterium]|uniref:Glycoprotease family protein n=2 Tax=Candidatus Magasanikiibacteriota TaxID=1752731 RepID=A0A0G0YV76_9BACT|nr:MAG: Glycoprotease family protein [Candidatus Magasanikbacteria bacterium GW2011_GWC2_41_17]KKS13576.1 MAG: Glycoprotease family protein [Candidatus Magasanikbacteria bacterium GW2011_GWA2_41_55]HBV57708.1 hypothetical protein [Candidatus Magasanikbacteria bacterium]HBX16220.1 hypothetical protein [Candidatus Magasanikbacteria bacterium]